MKLNIYILFNELKEFNPILLSNANYDLKLDHARILIDKSDFDHREQTIYIINISLYMETYQLLDEYSFIVVGEAVNNYVPQLENGIYIYNELSLSLIAEKIHEIFMKYYKWQQEIKDVYIKNNGKYIESLQEILNIGSKLLLNPIAIFDISSTLLFYAGELPKNLSGSIWEEVLSKKRYDNTSLNEEEQKMIYKSFLKDQASDPSSFQYYKGEEDIAYTVLFHNNKPFATLGMTGILNPITEDQYSIFYYLKEILEHIHSEYELINTNNDFPLYLIESLLKNNEIEDFILDFHLSKKGWQLNDIYCILNIHKELGGKFVPGEEASLRQTLKNYFPESIFHNHENCILIILPNGRKDIEKHYKLNCFFNTLTHYKLNCTISSDFFSFKNIKYSFIETKYLMQFETPQNYEKRIYFFERYYDRIIVSILNQNAEIESLCHNKLLTLYIKGDLTVEMIEIIKKYLLSGKNTLSTAKKLHLHRNTLSYKLNKIEETIGFTLSDLDDSQVFWILMSCYLLL